MPHFSPSTTPRKRYPRGVVTESVDTCVLCNNVARQRYFIVTEKGTDGSAKRDIEHILDVKFLIRPENFGAHICSPCKNMLTKANGYKTKLNAIEEKVKSHGQNLKQLWANKRTTPQSHTPKGKLSPSPSKQVSHKNLSPSYTPNRKHSRRSISFTSSNNSYVAPTPSSVSSGLTPPIHICDTPPISSSDVSAELTPPSQISDASPLTPPIQSSDVLFFPQEDTVELTVASEMMSTENSMETSPDPTRTQTLRYRTSNVAKNMSPVALSLRNGSIKKTLETIHAIRPIDFQSYVALLVKREGEEIVKYDNSNIHRESSPELLRETNLENMMHRLQEHCPLTYTVASKFASSSGRKQKVKVNQVLAALLILLKSKNQNINRFQMANALAMYKFNLSKEGFQYLSSMGVTVSHATLHNKLQEVASKMVTATIKKLKKGQEQNCVSLSSFVYLVFKIFFKNISR